MSDSTIAGLTAATTPLAGTEELPVWQGGGTKRVPVADVGRLYTAGPGLILAGSEFADPNPVDDHRRVTVFEDFYSTAYAKLLPANSGGNTSIIGSNITNLGGNGIVRLTTGTGASGAAALLLAVSNFSNNQLLEFGSGAAVWEALVIFGPPSDATDQYRILMGWLRAPIYAHTSNADGLLFAHDRNAFGDDNLRVVSRNNNSNRVVDSGLTVGDGVSALLRIEVNAAGTEVRSYVNASLVDTNTTNIPTGPSRRVSMGLGVAKLAGTTSRHLDVDYVRMDHAWRAT